MSQHAEHPSDSTVPDTDGEDLSASLHLGEEEFDHARLEQLEHLRDRASSYATQRSLTEPGGHERFEETLVELAVHGQSLLDDAPASPDWLIEAVVMSLASVIRPLSRSSHPRIWDSVAGLPEDRMTHRVALHIAQHETQSPAAREQAWDRVFRKAEALLPSSGISHQIGVAARQVEGTYRRDPQFRSFLATEPLHELPCMRISLDGLPGILAFRPTTHPDAERLLVALDPAGAPVALSERNLQLWSSIARTVADGADPEALERLAGSVRSGHRSGTDESLPTSTDGLFWAQLHRVLQHYAPAGRAAAFCADLLPWRDLETYLDAWLAGLIPRPEAGPPPPLRGEFAELCPGLQSALERLVSGGPEDRLDALHELFDALEILDLHAPPRRVVKLLRRILGIEAKRQRDARDPSRTKTPLRGARAYQSALLEARARSLLAVADLPPTFDPTPPDHVVAEVAKACTAIDSIGGLHGARATVPGNVCRAIATAARLAAGADPENAAQDRLQWTINAGIVHRSDAYLRLSRGGPHQDNLEKVRESARRAVNLHRDACQHQASALILRHYTRSLMLLAEVAAQAGVQNEADAILQTAEEILDPVDSDFRATILRADIALLRDRLGIQKPSSKSAELILQELTQENPEVDAGWRRLVSVQARKNRQEAVSTCQRWAGLSLDFGRRPDLAEWSKVQLLLASGCSADRQDAVRSLIRLLDRQPRNLAAARLFVQSLAVEDQDPSVRLELLKQLGDPRAPRGWGAAVALGLLGDSAGAVTRPGSSSKYAALCTRLLVTEEEPGSYRRHDAADLLITSSLQGPRREQDAVREALDLVADQGSLLAATLHQLPPDERTLRRRRQRLHAIDATLEVALEASKEWATAPWPKWWATRAQITVELYGRDTHRIERLLKRARLDHAGNLAAHPDAHTWLERLQITSRQAPVQRDDAALSIPNLWGRALQAHEAAVQHGEERAYEMAARWWDRLHERTGDELSVMERRAVAYTYANRPGAADLWLAALRKALEIDGPWHPWADRLADELAGALRARPMDIAGLLIPLVRTDDPAAEPVIHGLRRAESHRPEVIDRIQETLGQLVVPATHTAQALTSLLSHAAVHSTLGDDDHHRTVELVSTHLRWMDEGRYDSAALLQHYLRSAQDAYLRARVRAGAADAPGAQQGPGCSRDRKLVDELRSIIAGGREMGGDTRQSVFAAPAAAETVVNALHEAAADILGAEESPVAANPWVLRSERYQNRLIEVDRDALDILDKNFDLGWTMTDGAHLVATVETARAAKRAIALAHDLRLRDAGISVTREDPHRASLKIELHLTRHGVGSSPAAESLLRNL